MKVTDLNREQILELKQRILEESNEAYGEGTSYGELADADTLVSNDEVIAAYRDTEFTPEDFNCPSGGVMAA